MLSIQYYIECSGVKNAKASYQRESGELPKGENSPRSASGTI
jgi:hypothetical protein